ncbi:MAG: phosphoadenosine phosphosulfate reductase family protein [Syntrophobacter sp.]
MTDLIDEIRQQLRAVNIVSFSGGKDSTTVLQHVFAALRGTDKRLYIVTSDTLMEIPYFQAYVDRVKDRLRDYIESSGINAEVITVRPEPKDSFWVSILGKGYPAAHMGFRWCTGKLKIDPIIKFTKQVISGVGKDWKVFVGVRAAESELRARIYKKKDYKPNHYAPILFWTSHDVWEFLLTDPCPWGDHSELVRVYRYSSDECVYGEKQGVCVGNARYGCWACPLQKESQLKMIGMHTGEIQRYKELRRFKGMLVGLANKSGYRSQIRRNGEVGCGPFLVEIRKRLYRELKEVEIKTGWKLITPEEEACIFDHWETDCDVHNIPDPKQPMLWGCA